ncbi:MAG: hypothetical protein Q9201_004041 [Fulgogasparrea decipioides]
MDTNPNDKAQAPYGRRLLPAVLDQVAKVNPHKVFAAFAVSDDVSQGFRDVTFDEMAQAVDSMAYSLQSTFGCSPANRFETLTFIGLPDLRYNIVFYAAVKCGYKVLLPSPRNLGTTNLSLMEQTGSSKLLYTKELDVVVQELAGLKGDIQCEMIESLERLLESRGPHYPYNSRFDEAVGQPVVVLHSSGSTRLPKPVVMTHGTFATFDNDRKFPTVPGRRNNDLTIWDFEDANGRMYEPFPPFHLAGFFNKVMVPVFTNAIPVFGPPLRPPSGALAAEILRQQHVRRCLLPPSVAEQLLHSNNGLDLFKQLEIFCYAGGPLSQAAGDAISGVTTVCQFYGSTEVGQIRLLVPQPEDWSYMEFHPAMKLEFQPWDDDTFELVLFADQSTASSSALNHNLPGVDTWYTKDLFKPHATKHGLWRFHGRKDDIIVLSTGEKLNPLPMENLLQGLPMVSGALVIGQGRRQPALLIEYNPRGPKETNSLLEELWPSIETANAFMPAQGRIIRSRILLADGDKPFVRAGKGTVIRKLTEAAYADEITDLYAEAQKHETVGPPTLTATIFAPAAIKDLIRSVLLPVLHQDVSDSDNLYSSGLDSLKTVEALGILRSSLLPHRPASELHWLSADTFYDHPTVNQISEVISNFLNHGEVPRRKDRKANLKGAFESFVRYLQRSPIYPPLQPKEDDVTMVLTGTTGSLGSCLLNKCAVDPKVSTIFCLNRSVAAEQKWHDQVSRRCVSDSSVTAKVHFITVDFGHQTLGLDPDHFNSLANDCDLIVHAAWKVDFNQGLSSFADNIRSVCTLANWSILSPRRPRFVFISSVSSVGLWNSTFKPETGIPEEPIEDLNAALPLGYGESKYISERLLDHAANQSNAPITILRVGQIGSATTTTHAKWTERELVPSMLKTSKLIGLIPEDLPAVDWIPVDQVSKIVSELAFADLGDPSQTPRYYHVVNPNPVPWAAYLPLVKQHCGATSRVVPLAEWVQELRKMDITNPQTLNLYPALKMLNFISLLASSGPTLRYQTSASKRASKTMTELKPVDESLMRFWLEQNM